MRLLLLLLLRGHTDRESVRDINVHDQWGVLSTLPSALHLKRAAYFNYFSSLPEKRVYYMVFHLLAITNWIMCPSKQKQEKEVLK